jgi:cyclopropane fatty-acyl-phospholipid synthase-like methyltransferase
VIRRDVLAVELETVRGVQNADILEFERAEPYDTVISISTLEHVGQDEVPRAPERAIPAFERLDRLARPDGRVLVTIPVGYNTTLDDALRTRRLRMPLETVLVRVDRENRWVEASLEEGLSRRYGTPYANANAVYVGIRAANLLRKSA